MSLIMEKIQVSDASTPTPMWLKTKFLLESGVLYRCGWNVPMNLIWFHNVLLSNNTIVIFRLYGITLQSSNSW